MRAIDKIIPKKSNHVSHLKIKPFVLFAFCLFLYMPRFNIPYFITQFVSIGVPAIYLLIHIKYLGKINLRQWKFLLLSLFLVLLSVFVPIIHGTMDFSYYSALLFFSKNIIVYLALLCLVIKKHGRESASHYFLYYFILTHVVYVVGTILLVAFPSLRDMWFSIVAKDSVIENMGTLDASKYIFRIGWQGFAGFHLTFFCTLCSIFSLFLRYGVKQSEMSAKQFFICFSMCVLGNMFYGRSGLIVTIAVSVLSVIYWNRKNLKRLFSMVASVVLLFALGIGVLKGIPALNNWYEWMSSPIRNLISTGEMQDKSFDKLQEMQNVEISDKTFLTGDGYYSTNGHYYMYTDAGFIRNVLFWGIIGAVFSYGLVIYSLLGIKKKSRLFAAQLLIVLIAFEYKGAIYYVFLPLAFAIESAFLLCDKKADDENKGGLLK